MTERILIVDDEADVRSVLSQFLSLNGFQVVQAATLEEALKISGESDFDFVIQDMMLPDGDGMDLLETLKAKNPNLPVVMMTGSGSDSALQLEAKKKGAVDFIPKTYPLADLLALLKRHLMKK